MAKEKQQQEEETGMPEVVCEILGLKDDGDAIHIQLKAEEDSGAAALVIGGEEYEISVGGLSQLAAAASLLVSEFLLDALLSAGEDDEEQEDGDEPF